MSTRTTSYTPPFITLADGRVRLDAAAFPVMSGSGRASRVAAVMFDYTCAVC